MLNFKKLASTFIFSLFAFQSTVFAVPRYAKVVLLGGKGSGKTTIQKLINKDYDISNIPHTTQISYISVPVFYDNKGNFTFDEDRDVQRYNKEVILNICDTPAVEGVKEMNLEQSYDEEDENDEVIRFAQKRSNVLIFLANEKESYIDIDSKFVPDCSFVKCFVSNIRNNARKIIISTCSRSDEYEDFMSMGYLKSFARSNVDTIKALTLSHDYKLKENKKTECNNEISFEYIAKTKEIFNKNNIEDLRKYANAILNLIAKLVYKYGIDKLEFDNSASDYTIFDGKLVKGH